MKAMIHYCDPLWPVQTEQSKNIRAQHLGLSAPPQHNSVSFCYISSLQQSPLPYNPKPSDHSHLALTQSLSIYMAQGEERVNVGNISPFCENREQVSLIHGSVLYAISDHPCLCCFYWGKLCVWCLGKGSGSRLWAAVCCHNKWCSCVIWVLKKAVRTSITPQEIFERD